MVQQTKTPMPTQAPEIRAHNFDEVARGYTEEMAVLEAQRCLHCKNRPCVDGCPVKINIPDFIAMIKESRFEDAYGVIRESSSLPAVCGRVCPQETQCEARCVRGVKGESVAIGRLERFVADRHREAGQEKVSHPIPNGHKVAVIGAGPSGLTCAGDLAAAGCTVTVFEALHEAGGVLLYGIPEFRLPKAIVKNEIDSLRAMGVEIVTNTIVGKTVTVDELLSEGYEAIYIASGAGLPMFMGIPGEGLNGVFSANEFLTRSNLMKAFRPDSATPIHRGKQVSVVGGGNVAMDAARTALRLGADKVQIVYRRSMEELPARKEEVEHAMEEGIEFRLLTNPTEILGQEGWVSGLKCLRMELGEPDERGRRRPVPVEGSEFTFPVDTVIMALGTSPNPLISSTTQGLDTNRHGCIIAEEGTGKTSRPFVYAGGDAVTGAATVISAMGAGKEAAHAIIDQLQKK